MVVRFIVFLTSATLIFRGTDISNCFRESLGIRDNESRRYFHFLYGVFNALKAVFLDSVVQIISSGPLSLLRPLRYVEKGLSISPFPAP